MITRARGNSDHPSQAPPHACQAPLGRRRRPQPAPNTGTRTTDSRTDQKTSHHTPARTNALILGLALSGYPYVASREVGEVDMGASVRLEPQRAFALGHRAEVHELSVRGIMQLEIALAVAVERQDLHGDLRTRSEIS